MQCLGETSKLLFVYKGVEFLFLCANKKVENASI